MIEDVLQRAEKFSWWRFRHAYGFATDVPKILRSITSVDEDERYDGYYGGLYSAVTHQYTPYSATAPTIRFLVLLLAEPELPEKERLLEFLQFCAEHFRLRNKWERFLDGLFLTNGNSI